MIFFRFEKYWLIFYIWLRTFFVGFARCCSNNYGSADRSVKRDLRGGSNAIGHVGCNAVKCLALFFACPLSKTHPARYFPKQCRFHWKTPRCPRQPTRSLHWNQWNYVGTWSHWTCGILFRTITARSIISAILLEAEFILRNSESNASQMLFKLLSTCSVLEYPVKVLFHVLWSSVFYSNILNKMTKIIIADRIYILDTFWKID